MMSRWLGDCRDGMANSVMATQWQPVDCDGDNDGMVMAMTMLWQLR